MRSRHANRSRTSRVGRAVSAVASLAVAASLFAVAPAAQADESDPSQPGFPAPTKHSQKAYDPEANFTSKWTRADARQIMAQSNPNVPKGQSSMPVDQTMPDIPKDFPAMNDDVWVWDTWSLTDSAANQVSYKGWDVIFSLVADRHAGYDFDQRHWNARIGFFFRKSNADPNTAKWNYGGHVFPEGSSISNTEWSGSARIQPNGKIKMFYTAINFSDVAARNAGGGGTPPDAAIASAMGNIHADDNGVSFDGFVHTKLLEPDGTMYQTKEQNAGFAFRDPFTFEDPAHPGKTYMVFEGNTAGTRGGPQSACTKEDLGYKRGEKNGETPEDVTASGANLQAANVGLAVATNADLTEWKLLPPLLSANCVNDQTERPQIYMQREKGGKLKYYLFTISHQFTYAAGLRGPDGVYGFAGKGLRSDFEPMNKSGLTLGSPTDLNLPAESPEAPTPGQNPRQFQAYSHYVQPGGLVQSFIDNVDGKTGGTLSPTVKINFSDARSAVDRTFGQDGLGPYGYLPTNTATDQFGIYHQENGGEHQEHGGEPIAHR